MTESSTLPVERLTDRQRECLRLVGRGYTSKEIALQLDLSFETVDQHVKRAMQLLGAASRAEAARMLAAFDAGHPQRLVTQSEPIAEPPPEPPSRLQATGSASILKLLLSALFGLPALGGPENDLSANNRLAHILRIGFVSAVIMFAILVVATGTISLLR